MALYEVTPKDPSAPDQFSALVIAKGTAHARSVAENFGFLARHVVARRVDIGGQEEPVMLSSYFADDDTEFNEWSQQAGSAALETARWMADYR